MTSSQLICYICHDADSDEALVASPCGRCKMQVHPSCFNEHQLHQFQNNQCVVMKDGKEADSAVIYMTCSMCKTRHEHESPELLRLLSQHANRDDAETRQTGHHYAMITTQFICSFLSTVPEDTRERALMATRTVVQSLARLSTDELTPQIKTALHAFRASLYIATFSITIASFACLRSCVTGLWAS